MLRGTFAKPLIFVVEDEPDLREIMLYNLVREGYEALGFESGSEGLEAIRAKQPNLVILDLMLPDMDGTDRVSAGQSRIGNQGHTHHHRVREGGGE